MLGPASFGNAFRFGGALIGSAAAAAYVAGGAYSESFDAAIGLEVPKGEYDAGRIAAPPPPVRASIYDRPEAAEVLDGDDSLGGCCGRGIAIVTEVVATSANGGGEYGGLLDVVDAATALPLPNGEYDFLTGVADARPISPLRPWR